MLTLMHTRCNEHSSVRGTVLRCVVTSPLPFINLSSRTVVHLAERMTSSQIPSL